VAAVPSIEMVLRRMSARGMKSRAFPELPTTSEKPVAAQMKG
jgi:hypothetical protein